MSTSQALHAMLERRLTAAAREWFDGARAEVARGCSDDRFCQLLSQASRFATRRAAAPDSAERRAAHSALEGWNPERWTCLEMMRVALVLARPDLEGDGVLRALDEAFRYADVGEDCALYKSLAHLPRPERLAWRAGEGARSNMRVVFESVCCDTPYPTAHFDEIAWRQAVIKCLFIEAPLWRFWKLDSRLDAELARMALDLVEERRSAARPINPELWMCLGEHAGGRGRAQLERELREGPPRGRAGAGLALVRCGDRERVQSALALEQDPLARQVLEDALAKRPDSTAWSALDPSRAAAAGVR